MPKLFASIAVMLGCAIALAGTAVVFAQDAKPAVPAAQEKKADAKPAPDTKTVPDAKKAPDATKPAEKPAPKVSTATGPEKVLVDKGLTKNEKKFLLDEAAVVEKYEAAKPLLADLQKAMYKYGAMAEFDDGLATMEMQHQMLQQESNALQQQITITSNTNARMRGTMNNQLITMRQQAAEYQAETTQLNTQITQAKTQGPKPEERAGVIGEIERTRSSYIDAVKEIETVLTPLLAQYHDVASDKEVVDALAQLKKKTVVNYKLGPSAEVVAATAMVRELKRQIGMPTKSPKAAKAKKAVTKKAKTKGLGSPGPGS